MEIIKDIKNNELKHGDLVVFEHYTRLDIGRFSHIAETTVVIKDIHMKFNMRYIRINQTHHKILKLER